MRGEQKKWSRWHWSFGIIKSNKLDLRFFLSSSCSMAAMGSLSHSKAHWQLKLERRLWHWLWLFFSIGCPTLLSWLKNHFFSPLFPIFKRFEKSVVSSNLLTLMSKYAIRNSVGQRECTSQVKWQKNITMIDVMKNFPRHRSSGIWM